MTKTLQLQSLNQSQDMGMCSSKFFKVDIKKAGYYVPPSFPSVSTPHRSNTVRKTSISFGEQLKTYRDKSVNHYENVYNSKRNISENINIVGK